MIKVLVLIFGLIMFFGGFWRATEDKKRIIGIDFPDEQPTEPETLPIEAENTILIAPKYSENKTLPRTTTKVRAKSRRSKTSVI